MEIQEQKYTISEIVQEEKIHWMDRTTKRRRETRQ